jgi:hypothetical protein
MKKIPVAKRVSLSVVKKAGRGRIPEYFSFEKKTYLLL